MNFKRKRCRRQVRCTLCTPDRWKGNKGGVSDGRLKAKDMNLEKENVSIHLPKRKRRSKPKPFLLMRKYVGPARDHDEEWRQYSSYDTKSKALQARDSLRKSNKWNLWEVFPRKAS